VFAAPAPEDTAREREAEKEKLYAKIGQLRIERLYKMMDRPNPNTSKPATTTHKLPYLLRGLDITRPNQAWAADITFIAMKHG
jgi:putative transposase